MINLSISLALWVAVSAFFQFVLETRWFLSLPMGFIAGLIAIIFLGRQVQQQLESIMAQMQKQVQANKFDQAITTLQQGLKLKHRQFFVEAQINAQIGMLYYLKKDFDKARPYLKKGFLKHYIAQGMLACIYFRQKDYAQMKEVMDSTVKANKKESLVYSLYAYLLHRIEEVEPAIDILKKGLRKLPNDDKMTTNLVLLQNNKKPKMRAYGDLWLQFMLEKPPKMMAAPNNPFQHGRVSKRAHFG
jgi:tetratricopeptide (TPR) repeat protein